MTTTEDRQRDELADEIAGHPIGSGYYSTTVGVDEAREIAGAILAAGFRKPRIITTVEELDALPEGVLILTEQGGYWESIKRGDGRNWWSEPGARNVSGSEELTLPAAVINEPEAEAGA